MAINISEISSSIISSDHNLFDPVNSLENKIDDNLRNLFYPGKYFRLIVDLNKELSNIGEREKAIALNYLYNIYNKAGWFTDHSYESLILEIKNYQEKYKPSAEDKRL